jgi:hypothetical protein
MEGAGVPERGPGRFQVATRASLIRGGFEQAKSARLTANHFFASPRNKRRFRALVLPVRILGNGTSLFASFAT